MASRSDSSSYAAEDRDLEKASDLSPDESAPADQSPETQDKENEEDDPNVVGWDGPDDPQNPHNWPRAKIWSNFFFVATLAFMSPFGSSLFAPAVPVIMRQFNSNSRPLETLVVSIYLLGYAAGPLLTAPLSELYGRLPVYRTS